MLDKSSNQDQNSQGLDSNNIMNNNINIERTSPSQINNLSAQQEVSFKKKKFDPLAQSLNKDLVQQTPNPSLTEMIKGFRAFPWVYDDIFTASPVFNRVGAYPIINFQKALIKANFLRNLNQSTQEEDHLQFFNYQCNDYAVSGRFDAQLIAESRISALAQLAACCKQAAFRLQLQKELNAFKIISRTAAYPSDHVKNYASESSKWSSQDFSVLEAIRAAKNVIAKNSGFEPNRLVISKDVFEQIQEKSEFAPIIANASVSQITPESLAQFLMLDKVVVASAFSKENKDASSSKIWTNMALLYYYPHDPSLSSFARSFQFQPSPAVYKWQTEEGGRFVSYSVVDSYQFALLNPKSAFLFIQPIS